MDNIIKNYSVIVFDVGGTLMEYSGMPDKLFKAQIDTLVNSCDFYISSQSCGYRKPNPR